MRKQQSELSSVSPTLLMRAVMCIRTAFVDSQIVDLRGALCTAIVWRSSRTTSTQSFCLPLQMWHYVRLVLSLSPKTKSFFGVHVRYTVTPSDAPGSEPCDVRAVHILRAIPHPHVKVYKTVKSFVDTEATSRPIFF